MSASRVRSLCRISVVLPLLLPIAAVAADQPAGAGKPVDYVRDIRPILTRACYNCHGPDAEERKAGLRLDLRDAATATLETGARAIVPGQLEESELWSRITTDDPALRMPPGGHGELKPDQIATIRRWIEQQAPFAEHWSFVPPHRAPLPQNANPHWARNGIDRFIAAKHQELGLTANPEADRHTLIRRLSLDLRGLPPTPAEVADFINDSSPAAYEELVDRLLDDPAYGERWGRVWLDLARYADSKGLGSDPLRTIWRYRDWVIDAFNRNLPFDQFTIEQIAGDMLPESSLEQKIATAFHRNTLTNTEGGTDDEEYRVAAVKDRVDTTMQVWMGLTIGCAKCHSHKFDPISQTEYYQFFGIFNQSADSDKGDEYPTLAAPTPDVERTFREIEQRIAELKKELDRSTPELAHEQRAWENSLGQQPQWTAVSSGELKSARGATLTHQQADDSILVSGEHPDNDTYTVIDTLPFSGITALKLESIPDPALPSQGAGRAADGNFVLSRISATVADAEQDSRDVAGRFIRIELPGEGKILSLAEVEVLAGAENLARTGKATQSSTDFAGPPEFAIDGNKSGVFEQKSVTHTRTESNPWWEVDLGDVKRFDRIVVWNRTDGDVGVRLAGAKVIVLDAERQPVWQEVLTQAPKANAEFSATGAQTVLLTQATADYSQGGFPVGNALAQKDLTASGWAVGPQIAQPHSAIFVASSPAGRFNRTRLTVTLEHRYKQPKYTLGRFRISATSSSDIIRRVGVPTDVLEIVDRSPSERTPDQQNKIAAYYRTIAPSLQPLRDQIAQLTKSRPEVPTVPVMVELPPEQQRKTRLMIKGNFLNTSDEVQAAVPRAFHAIGKEGPVNRLELARWLVDRNNPLTARVMANRLWSQVFGIGLVETEEDFGSQGDLPTHPELLDWLALEFMADWDVKRLLKTMVCSATYRQTAQVTPEKTEKDPRNRYLARAPRFRLEAEMVRDQALALSGLLSRKSHGPSVFPPQPAGLWQAAFNGERTWTTSPGEDKYRRGLYTLWRRTVPYPSMAAFDAPSREICTVRRVRTNTPLQAFVTLNDPVYVEASQALGRRLVREGGVTPVERVRYGLELVLARPAQAAQIDQLVALFESEKSYYSQHEVEAVDLATNPLGPLAEGQTAADLAAWTVVGNVLLNLDGVLTKN